MMTPLDYARAACDTLMRRYAAPDLPPKPQFHYHQGVFLSGMHETWKLCKEEARTGYERRAARVSTSGGGQASFCGCSGTRRGDTGKELEERKASGACV